MRNKCLTMEELTGLAELSPPLPADDPGSRHVDECPRCKARLNTYREFLAGSGTCSAKLLAQAVDRLGVDLDQEIFGAETTEPKPSPARIFPGKSPVLSRFLGVAAVLLLFFAVDGLWDRPVHEQNLLRSDQAALPGDDPLQTATEILPDGGVEWRWQPVTEADSYRIQILDARFELLADLPVGGEPTLRLTASRLDKIIPAPGAYLWVVIALRDGDVILHSKPYAFVVGLEK